MTKWNLNMQAQYTSEMLGTYNEVGAALPSWPTCVASEEHLGGHCAKQDVLD